MCLACGHEWNYKGHFTRPTCPRCKLKVNMNPKYKHHISIDLNEHGSGIINAIKAGKSMAVLDCLGNNVVDVSIID